MVKVNLADIQQDFMGCLHRVEEGGTLLVVQGDKTVAEVKAVAAPLKQLRPFGLAKGQVWIADDFDDPLPEDILRLFEGEDE